jgi:amino acid transporter
MLVMFNFLGYYNICNLGDEVREPERVIPQAIIGSIVLVLVLDLAISVSFTGALPWREMIKPGTVIYDAVGSVFMERVAGFWAGQWLTVMVLVTAFASVYSMMLGYSRIPFAAALDGTFFRFFAKTHPTKDFPHRSLLLVGVLSAIASLFDLVEIITALILARILIMFVGQIIGLLLLRKRQPEAPRPFRMWLYPLPALFLRTPGLAIHGLRSGGVRKRDRSLPDPGPAATVLALWIGLPRPLSRITRPGTSSPLRSYFLRPHRVTISSPICESTFEPVYPTSKPVISVRSPWL